MERSRRAPRITRQRTTRAAVASTLLLALTAWTGTGIAGAVKASGATVSAPDGSSLSHGGSATPFSVVLPAGAKCPGDTAHKWYHVDSFLVPSGVSPASVNFRGGVPSKWYGLIANGAYVGALNTARDSGLVVNLPIPDVWSRLTPKELFASSTTTTSTWSGGIACANASGAVTNYWAFTVRFTRDAHDHGGFTWTVTSQKASSGSSSSTSSFVVIAIAIGAGGAFLVLRGRRDVVRHRQVRTA